MRLPQNIAAPIDQVARKAIGKDWALYASLIDHWREIVGEEYAQKTSPAKVVFPKGKKKDQQWANKGNIGGGSLTIRLPHGLAMEFQFISAQIKSRINGFFGYEAITRILFETYYDAPPPPSQHNKKTLSQEGRAQLERDMATLENEELRSILHKLGESILISHEKD
ncbi:MAG: DUF721 domain-containing protein [Bdellovibrionales bacterium]